MNLTSALHAARPFAASRLTGAAPWLALGTLMIVASALSPHFLTTGNLTNIVRQSSVVAIAAIGTTFVMVSGHVDLSVGATISVAAIVASWVMAGDMSLMVPAVAAALLVGGGIGAVNGLVVARWRVPSFVATLGTGIAILGFGQLQSGGLGVGAVPSGFREVLNGSIGPLPIAVVVLCAVAVVGLAVQSRTKFGLQLYVAGANPKVAAVSGLPVTSLVGRAFVLSGITAAVAGLILFARSGLANPTAGAGLEFDVLAAILLGGTTFRGGHGGVGGTVAGALVLVVAFNLVNLLGLSFNAQLLIKGTVIVMAAAAHGLASRQ